MEGGLEGGFSRGRTNHIRCANHGGRAKAGFPDAEQHPSHTTNFTRAKAEIGLGDFGLGGFGHGDVGIGARGFWAFCLPRSFLPSTSPSGLTLQ